MKRTVVIFLGLILFEASCSKSNRSQDQHVGDTAAITRSNQGSIYSLPITFEDQHGAQVPWQSLRGKLRVMAMVFTHCPAACPVITELIKSAENSLPPTDKGKVGFTLISFDSKRDTAAQLREFYQEHGLDSNWTLLHGAPEDVRTVAGLLNVQYKEWPDGDFTHSDVIFVIDTAGNIVLRQEGIVAKNSEIIARSLKSLLNTE